METESLSFVFLQDCKLSVLCGSASVCTITRHRFCMSCRAHTATQCFSILVPQQTGTERLQMLLCSLHDVSFPALPSPHHTRAPQSLLNTFHVLQEEEASRDEEMRHRALKVKSFHLLWVPSLRHLCRFSELSITSAGGTGQGVPAGLLPRVPRARELGLADPPLHKGIVS